MQNLLVANKTIAKGLTLSRTLSVLSARATTRCGASAWPLLLSLLSLALFDERCTQGLGFRAPLIGVMDIPKLKLIFTGVASLASALAPAILLLGANTSAAGSGSA